MDKNKFEYSDYTPDQKKLLETDLTILNINTADVIKNISERKLLLQDIMDGEIGKLLNSISRTNRYLFSLSELPIAYADKYKEYSLDMVKSTTTQETIDKLIIILKQLDTPLVPGEPTPERKEYLDAFKGFFDEIYQRHNIPEEDRNFLVSSISQLSLTSEEELFIEESIKTSAYYKKNIKRIELDNQRYYLQALIENKTLDPHKIIAVNYTYNHIQSLFKDIEKCINTLGIQVTIKGDLINTTIDSLSINDHWIEISYKEEGKTVIKKISFDNLLNHRIGFVNV